MSKKKVVVALGHKALGATLPQQQTAVKNAAKAIADLVEADCQVVISHSNAPQVGMIHTAMNEFGGPRRRPFGKVLHFQKNRLHPSRCCLNGNPCAGNPTTDDQHIIGGLCRFLNGFLPIFLRKGHGLLAFFLRFEFEGLSSRYRLFPTFVQIISFFCWHFWRKHLPFFCH